MFTSVFRILTAAVVVGIALYPAAASAAPLGPAALAYSSSNAPSAGDPSTDTTVTFSVTVGALAITAPGTADLGSGLPGGRIDGSLGNVVVTDDRANLAAAWTATASSTNWALVGGGGTGPETILAGDVTYDPGTVTTTGDITATPHPITLSGTAQTVVAGTAGIGNNTATWDPALQVSVPSAAVGGDYTGTITDSVS
jgi:hypothetical protein